MQLSEMTSFTQEEMSAALRNGAAKGMVELPIHSDAQIGNPATTGFRVSLLRSAARGERLILLTQDQLKTTAEALTNMNYKRLELKEKLDRLEAAHLDLHQTLFSMESFAQAAAHDLRTPINTLSGLIEMFQTNFDADLPPKAKEFLQYMARATTQMNDYTSELLEHARSSAVQIVAEPVDISDAIFDVCANLESQIAGNNCEINVTGTSFKVMAEPTMLQILITNLITNAIKFKSPHRRCKIDISLSSRGAGSFALRDNGVGFDQSEADAVFKPFQRLSLQTDGNGIGLATCAEVCRRHSWKIQAEAAIDQGATFSVQFGKL